MSEHHDPEARIALRDRWSAARWAARALVGIAVVTGGLLFCEHELFTHADATWAQVDGFPASTIVDLQNCTGAIVHVGDSVVQTAVQDQPDRRIIPLMEEAEIHDSVHMVARAATAAGLHDAWLSVLASLDHPPRAVIIGVNPRSFSPHWERNPAWVYTDEASAVTHPLFTRILSVLEWDWGRPTQEEYEATPVVVAGHVVGTVESLERPELGYAPPPAVARGRYVTRYAADYRRSHRLAELRKLVRDASAAPFPVILYLTPIDVDQARSQLTPVEQRAMEANLQLLRAELARSRWPHPDFSELVRTPDFDHPAGDPHEHLRSGGRLVVARGVAQALVRVGVVDAPAALPAPELRRPVQAPQHATPEPQPAPHPSGAPQVPQPNGAPQSAHPAQLPLNPRPAQLAPNPRPAQPPASPRPAQPPANPRPAQPPPNPRPAQLPLTHRPAVP